MSFDLSLTVAKPTKPHPPHIAVHCPVGDIAQPKYSAGMVLWYITASCPNVAYPVRVTGGPILLGQGYGYYVAARYLPELLDLVSESELIASIEEAHRLVKRRDFKVVVEKQVVPNSVQSAILKEWAELTKDRPEGFYQCCEVFKDGDRLTAIKRRVMESLAKKGLLIHQTEVGFRPFIRGGDPWVTPLTHRH